MRALMSTVLMATLVGAAVAQAQQHQHGQPQKAGQGQHQMGGMQMGGGMQGGMMMGGEGLPGPLRSFGAYAPDKLLKMKEMLELTADQEARLTELAAAAKKAGEDAHAPAMAAMQSLRAELAKPAPDKETIRGFVVAHATAEGNMQWAVLDGAMQAKALLTEAQRKHVEEMK